MTGSAGLRFSDFFRYLHHPFEMLEQPEPRGLTIGCAKSWDPALHATCPVVVGPMPLWDLPPLSERDPADQGEEFNSVRISPARAGGRQASSAIRGYSPRWLAFPRNKIRVSRVSRRPLPGAKDSE